MLLDTYSHYNCQVCRQRIPDIWRQAGLHICDECGVGPLCNNCVHNVSSDITYHIYHWEGSNELCPFCTGAGLQDPPPDESILQGSII